MSGYGMSPGDAKYWFRMGGIISLYAYFMTQKMAAKMMINKMVEDMKKT